MHKPRDLNMSDIILPERNTFPAVSIANSRSPRRWLVGLWMTSVVLGTIGWWAGLAWAAALILEHAIPQIAA